MEQTEEYVDGQLKARYGDCFLRGNNGKKSWNLCINKIILVLVPDNYKSITVHESVYHISLP